MEEIKTIMEEQIDVLNARPRRNIGEARAKLQEISQVPVMTAEIPMVFLEVARSSAFMPGFQAL